MTEAPAYRIDDVAVSSAAFYAAACDAQRSVVVEACAGAGKTWMLVSRIVRALLDGVLPQQILAITFTRKAAGEMRTRLDEWLAHWADPATAGAELIAALRERGCDAARAEVEAPLLRGLQRRLLAGGREVEVRTFHGWFAQLLLFAPLALREPLGLPAAMQLIEDTAPLRAPLWRRLHLRVLDDATLLEDYRHLVQRHRRARVAAWLDAAWNKAAELQAADAAGALEGSVPSAAEIDAAFRGLHEPAQMLCLPATADRLRALVHSLRSTGRAKAIAAANGLEAALQLEAPSAVLAAAMQALFNGKGQPRKLGAVDGLAAACENLATIRDATLQQQAHDDHLRMVRLSRALRAEYAALKFSRGLVDMGDLEQAASRLLTDAELSGWLQERLDLRWRQVLIDEFQDTSPLQWHALSAWLAGYAGAGGGASGQQAPSVFIVGDPKQSIYRFRRAEPRVFNAAKAFVVEGLQGRCLACDHTWRNAAAVVEAVNDVFNEVWREGSWPVFRAHTTASPLLGSVQRLPDVTRTAAAVKAPRRDWRPSLTEPRREVEERLRQQELRGVARGVASLIATPGWRPDDVMVLSRRRVLLGELSAHLAGLGVPHVMPEALVLAESPEALDVIALLDALASPCLDLSLARALKSPLFAAGDDDLLWLSLRARDSAAYWLPTLLACDGPPSAALTRAQHWLRVWREAAGRLAPHELIEQVIVQGELRQRLVAAVPAARECMALQAVDALLDAAIDPTGSLRGGRFATLYGFVRALRSGSVQMASAPPSRAVQLLTVHGAKGLEARAVFVIDTDPARRPDDLATLLVDWPLERLAPRRAAFVVPSAIAPSLRPLWDDERQCSQREELNALYVAMTRARERLVVSRTEASARDGTRPWWQRLLPLAQPWQPPGGVDLTLSADTAWLQLPPRLSPCARRATATETDALPAHSALLGRAVHRALEWAAREDCLSDPERWPALAQAAAAAWSLPPDGSERVVAAVQAILGSASCRRFFEPRHLRWSGDEVPLAWHGRALRADRIVQIDDGPDAGAWWVLDHKLHPRPLEVAAYRAQLAEYVAALGSLVPGETVHGAFITGKGEFHPL